MAAGYQVRAFCLYNSNGSWGWLDSLPVSTKALEVILGDIRDPLCVREAMQGCDLVFHGSTVAIPYNVPRRCRYQHSWHLKCGAGCSRSWSKSCGTLPLQRPTELLSLYQLQKIIRKSGSLHAASKIGADQID